MKKKALVVRGGGDGHTPGECAGFPAQTLAALGFEVERSHTLDSYLDEAKMNSLSVVVPIWTMGPLTSHQERGLLDAVRSGVGCARFHGGMCDAFRNNVE